MIRHIVMFNARNAADVPAIRDGLAVLGGIRHARRFEVGLNTRRDALSSDVDVIVYAASGICATCAWSPIMWLRMPLWSTGGAEHGQSVREHRRSSV